MMCLIQFIDIDLSGCFTGMVTESVSCKITFLYRIVL